MLLEQVNTEVSVSEIANQLFPEHKTISSEYYEDFRNAFFMMGRDFIKQNLEIYNDSVWAFNFGQEKFFCICHNLGMSEEIIYYGCNK
jgi:hypothetical protein